MRFFIDTNLVILMCFNASYGRSQLILPFILCTSWLYNLNSHLSNIISDFHKISLEQIAGYDTIIAANSWCPGLKIHDNRPKVNHFHNSTFTAAVKILRQNIPMIHLKYFCRDKIYRVVYLYMPLLRQVKPGFFLIEFSISVFYFML